MTVAFDALVGFFTSTTLVFILGSYLAPTPIRSAFTTVLRIDTQDRSDDNVTLDYSGHCHLGDDAWACPEVLRSLLSSDLTGYESEEELLELTESANAVLGLRSFLAASNWIFHGVLLVACYALLALAWEMTTEEDLPAWMRSSLRPLRRFAVATMALATLSGMIATASGLAVALRLSDLMRKHPQTVRDIYIGSGWTLTLLATIGCLAATTFATDLLLWSHDGRESQFALNGTEDADTVEESWEEKGEYQDYPQAVQAFLAFA